MWQLGRSGLAVQDWVLVGLMIDYAKFCFDRKGRFVGNSKCGFGKYKNSSVIIWGLRGNKERHCDPLWSEEATLFVNGRRKGNAK